MPKYSRARSANSKSIHWNPEPQTGMRSRTKTKGRSASNDERTGLVSLFIIGLAIYGLTHACGVSNLGGGGESGAEGRCETYIKTLLQAPATADFSGESAKDNGDKTWDVTGNVDSQNGFGANLRSSWTCTAKDDGNNGWSIVSGNVDG